MASVSLRPPGELASGPKIIKLNRAQFGYRLAVIAFGDEKFHGSQGLAELGAVGQWARLFARSAVCE